MKKKSIAILLIAVLLATLLLSCSSKEKEAAQSDEAFYQETTVQSSPLSYEDFIDSGKTIAAQIGDVYGAVANDIFKAKQVQEFTLAPDMLEAVRLGKVDAAILDGAYVKQIQDSGQYTDLDYLPVPKEVFVNMASNVFHTEELRDKFNEWFEKVSKDGTLDEIYSRWIGVSLPDEKDIPRFELTGENGTLKVCNTGNFPPFSYTDSNNQPVGFDEEITSRFAEHLGMDIEYSMMEYDAIIPYVLSGKADMSACSFTVTDDRSDSVIFGSTYVKAEAVLVIKKSDAPAAANDYTAFTGKDIAVITGALTVNTTEKIGGNPIEYNDSASAAEDVRKGRVAGYVNTLTAVQVMAAQMDGFDVIPVPKEIFAAQVGGISHDQAIIDRFNTFLAAAEADGTLGEMKNRWFSDRLDLDAPIPPIENSGTNGTLEVAICSDSIPYVYSGADNQYSGFSVELALRFGAYEGKNVKFTDLEFRGLIPYIVSKKADFALANMAITEERKKSVLFTDSFFDEQHGILALKADPADTRSYKELAGKRTGGVVGGAWEEAALKLGAEPVYYSEDTAGLEDVRVGRTFGHFYDLSSARVVAAIHEDLDYIEIPKSYFSAPMGAISMNQELIDRFNAFLADAKADGTVADMQERWLDNIPDLDSPMPDIPNDGAAGTIKVATCGTLLPFVYVGADGELKGYSIELLLRFGAHENMKIEFADMDFGALIPYVISGKADLSISAMSITEERKQSVLFSDSVYDDQWGVIVLKASASATDYTDFTNKKLGVITGMIADKIAEELFDAETVYYQDIASAIEDIRHHRANGLLYDLSPIRIIAGLPENEDLQCIPIPRDAAFVPVGAVSNKPDIISRFNKFLSAMTEDGTLADIQDRWLESMSALDNAMPEIPLKDENGILKVAIDDAGAPFAYRGENGELRGFCIELAMHFAAYEGMGIEFIPMDFSALIPYVGNGKADLGIDSIAITDERKKSILFTDAFYDTPLGILALKQADSTAVIEGGSFMPWLKTAIERNLITDNRWKMIVDGLSVTMTIAVLAQLFGTAFGCFVCWLLMRKNRFIKGIGNLYCGLIYGTPIVVLLMITYYIIFGDTNISNVLVAVAAFTMITGASVAQNLKGSIETVDTVEIEAARSIGFTAFQAFRTITLPQAVKRALPGYTNGFVELVKATAVVGYIAIQDLTRAGDIIRSRTYDAYFPLLLVAIIYLIVTTICVQLFKFIVKKVNQGGAA